MSANKSLKSWVKKRCPNTIFMIWIHASKYCISIRKTQIESQILNLKYWPNSPLCQPNNEITQLPI